MPHQEVSLWVRINGNGHAYGRELGCVCGRCRTVNYQLVPPPERLAEFAGWDDPPVRANTSASLLVGDAAGRVAGHVLIDAGGGVVDGLASAGIPGLGDVSAVLITHSHPDHVSGLNQLGESLRRTARAEGRPFPKTPLYCTLATFDALREQGGLRRVLARCFRFHEIAPEFPFLVDAGPVAVRVMPLPVVHGGAQGAVIYLAETLGKKVLFAWDIEGPDAAFPDGRTNREVFRTHASLLKHADLHLQECNTWSASGKGHTAYRQAQAYLEVVQARRTLLVHMSGHEDGPGHPGYGWTDAQWQAAAAADGLGAARQGMVLPLA